MKALRIYDTKLFLLGLALTIVGLIFIFDAGYARSLRDQYSAIPREFISQLMYIPVALVVAGLVAAVSEEKWRKLSKGLFLLAIISLFLPMVPGLGVERNGAHRWIKVGVEIQPAEFAKIAVILYLAGVFAYRKAWPGHIKRSKSIADYLDRIAVPKLMRFMPIVLVLLAVILIEKEPDLGTGAVVAFTAFVMCWLGGVTWKSMLAGSLVACIGVGLMVFKEPYRLERIYNHNHRYDPRNVDGVGYQTVQSEIGGAAAGVFGVGPGNGRTKHVIPAPTTDFITSTVAEEFGLVGIVVMLAILAALVNRLFQLARKARTPFAMMVLSGTAIWIGIQSVVNVMMANGTLPAIGIPLPFVSSGGSSLVALWMALGLCQAVVAPVLEKKEAKRAPSRHRWWHRRTRLSRA